MIALLAERASTNALWRQLPLEISTRLTLRFVQIVEHVRMYALYRQLIQSKKAQNKKVPLEVSRGTFLFCGIRALAVKKQFAYKKLEYRCYFV